MTAYPIDAPRGFVPRSELYAALKRVDELEAEVADLRLRLSGEREPVLVARICSLGFPLGRGMLLAAFYRAPPLALLTVDQLIHRGRVGTVWASDRPEHASDGALKSQICYLRRQWAAIGAQPADPIENVYRVGYRLRPEARAWLDAHMPPEPYPIHETRTTDEPDAITGGIR